MTQRLFWMLWCLSFGLYAIVNGIFFDTTKAEYIRDIICTIIQSAGFTFWMMKKDNT